MFVIPFINDLIFFFSKYCLIFLEKDNFYIAFLLLNFNYQYKNLLINIEI